MDTQWCTIIIIMDNYNIKNMKGHMNLIIEVITLPYQHGHNMQKNSEIVLNAAFAYYFVTHTRKFNNDPSIHH